MNPLATFAYVILAVALLCVLYGLLVFAVTADENEADAEYQSRLEGIAKREKEGRVLSLRKPDGAISEGRYVSTREYLARLT